MSAANAVNFITDADSVAVRAGFNVTITVDFDVNTDMVTVNALSTDGDSAGATFAMDNAVDNISSVTWEFVPTVNNADFNTNFLTITGTEVPEPASLALLGLGGLLMVSRHRRQH